MAASGAETNLLRFKIALDIINVRIRINEVTKILHECSIKELQTFYQLLVENIFGISGLGWNLHGILRNGRADDFDAIFKFLHPHGAFFEITYRLLGDVYAKYEYNVFHLPATFRTALQRSNVSQYFLDKLNVDPVTRTPLSFHLNSYEFYMFHFGNHLLSPQQARRQLLNNRIGHDTVYLHLTDQYISHLFPIETSVVLPTVHCSQLMTLRSPPQRTPPLSKLIKPSALKKILANVSAPMTQSHTENWRSDLLMQIIVYFWLHVPPEQRPGDSFSQTSPNKFSPYYGSRLDNSFGMDYGDSRVTGDQLRAVRNMVKHIHYFANNLRDDGSPMDEIRRSIRNVLQQPMYQFLRHNISHWPLDSSFLLLLETYLSYIQPWRYQKYCANSQTGQSTKVDASWSHFILENIETYTAIIVELISRFARMDLASPRHAHMVYRLTKVLAEPDLPLLLYNADLAVQNRGDIDSHVSMFSNTMETLVIGLMRNIRSTSVAVSAQENAALQQSSSSSFTQILKEWFVGPAVEDYSSSDRQTTLAYLEHSMQWLSNIFGIEAPEPLENSRDTPSLQPALLDPEIMRKQSAFIKYMGNPDLHPLRSAESATLVRLLLKFSESVNQLHGPKIEQLWYREDFYGRVCRHFLAPPCLAYHFVKTAPGNPAPSVATSLPPRVCLRPLASYRTIIFISILFFLPFLFNYSPPLIHLTIFLLYSAYVAARAAMEPLLTNNEQRQEPNFIPHDISFNE